MTSSLPCDTVTGCTKGGKAPAFARSGACRKVQTTSAPKSDSAVAAVSPRALKSCSPGIGRTCILTSTLEHIPAKDTETDITREGDGDVVHLGAARVKLSFTALGSSPPMPDNCCAARATKARATDRPQRELRSSFHCRDFGHQYHFPSTLADISDERRVVCRPIMGNSA